VLAVRLPPLFLLVATELLFGAVLPPRPIETNVRIVLRQAGDRVPVREQKLVVGILEMIVAAHVDHCRPTDLRRGITLSTVREHLGSELQLVVNDVPLDQKAAVGKVSVLSLGHDGFAGATVEGPRADVFLKPQRDLVPNLSNSKSFGITARGQLEHGEGADLREVLGFFDPSPLDTRFHVRQAELARTCATGQIGWIVRWHDGARDTIA
jgi:hypothetical protein